MARRTVLHAIVFNVYLFHYILLRLFKCYNAQTFFEKSYMIDSFVIELT